MKSKANKQQTTLSAILCSKPKTCKRHLWSLQGAMPRTISPIRKQNSSPLLLPHSWKGGECVTSSTPGPASGDPQQGGWAHGKSPRCYPLAIHCMSFMAAYSSSPYSGSDSFLVMSDSRPGPEATTRASPLGTGQQVDESSFWGWDLPCLPAVSRSH